MAALLRFGCESIRTWDLSPLYLRLTTAMTMLLWSLWFEALIDLRLGQTCCLPPGALHLIFMRYFQSYVRRPTLIVKWLGLYCDCVPTCAECITLKILNQLSPSSRVYKSHFWVQTSSHNDSSWAVVPTRFQWRLRTSHTPLTLTYHDYLNNW